MRFSGGLAGVAAAIILIGGVAVIPSASAADRAAVNAAPVSAPGTTLYVDTSGTCSDSGPGTEADPFCTVQAAANIVDPGQTVDIGTARGTLAEQPLTIARSGTPTEPITFQSAAGTGSDPDLDLDTQTGNAAVTLQDVHDVALSGLKISSLGTDDGIDVIGSSDVTLTHLEMDHASSSGTLPESDDIMIDGASSDVTVSRTEFPDEVHGAVLAKPGAQQVTLTTNMVEASATESGFTLDGTTGATVTSNTLLLVCLSGSSVGRSPVTFADGSSGTVENNIIESSAVAAGCTTPTGNLTVDATSANSAGGVTADYNAFFTNGSASDYSWAGASYADPAAFTAATGQGAHDLTLTTAVTGMPSGGSPAVNSADCSAPSELSTDIVGNSWVADPEATDASAGSGTCNASRGAYAPQDTISVTDTPPAADSAGYVAGTVPYTTGLTVTGDATSGWGEPVSFTVSFGDGSAPAPAAVGTPVNHTYATTGEYTITITATDTSGSTSSVILPLVYAVPDQAPVAGLTAAPLGLGSSRGIQPDTADFTASPASTGWNIASTTISYGGACTSFTGPAAPAGVTWECIYAEPGTYTATITVTDKLGRTSTASATITVGDEPVEVPPSTDDDQSVPAHGTVSLPMQSLEGVGCCAFGTFVEVIVSAAKQPGYITMYPDGTTRPDLATVQFHAGQPAENTALATGSTVDFYNDSTGSVNLQIVTYGLDQIVSGKGYGGYGNTFAPVTPATALPATKITGGRQIAFRVAGKYGVPANATAVVVDVTASGGSSAGTFESSPAGTDWAETALASPAGGWAKGQTVTSLVTQSTNNGLIQLENINPSPVSVWFTAQVVGYYLPGGSAAVFLPAATQSRLDTVTIGARSSAAFKVSGQDGIPASGTTAVAVNLTGYAATAPGTLTAYADGTTLPPLVSLSYGTSGRTDGESIAAVGGDGEVRLYNGGSKPVTVTADLIGSYYAYP